MGQEDTLHSGWGCGPGKKGRNHARLLSISQAGFLHWHEFSCLWTAWDPSKPGSGFALGTICFVCPPLCLSSAGLHSFHVFSEAPLVRYSEETLLIVSGAVTQLLSWVWANQALGPAKFLILRILIKQTCTLLSSLIRVHYQLGFTRLQSCWLRLLLGYCR